METNENQLNILEDKIDVVYKEMIKIKRYFLILAVISVIMILAPLLIAVLVLPSLLENISNVYGI